MATEQELYEMSDDELASYDFSDIETDGSVEDEDVHTDETEEEETLESEEDENEEEFSEEEPEEEDDSSQEEADDDDGDEEGNTDEDSESDEDEENQEEDESSNESDDDELNALKALLEEPIKAGGKEIKLNSASEIKALIQRGLGYYKAQNDIKPLRRFTDTLKQNNLLEEDKINYMIDLAKGDKEAIKRLIKENEIDINEFDVDDETNYTPKKHVVSQATSDVKVVLSSIEESEHYQATVSAVGGWDNASKADIEKDPNIIAAVNQHMENGVYAAITGEIDKRKLMGDTSLSGKSDLEAYMIVGNDLYGKPSDTNQAQGGQSDGQANNQPDLKKAPNLTKKRKKASAGKPKGSANNGSLKVSQSDLHKMDDKALEEHFEKLFG